MEYTRVDEEKSGFNILGTKYGTQLSLDGGVGYKRVGWHRIFRSSRKNTSLIFWNYREFFLFYLFEVQV
jgi:hypothetical protein